MYSRKKKGIKPDSGMIHLIDRNKQLGENWHYSRAALKITEA